MAGYRRLGMDDRVQIQVLTKRGISDAEIAGYFLDAGKRGVDCDQPADSPG
jgi:hypothetical protein